MHDCSRHTKVFCGDAVVVQFICWLMDENQLVQAGEGPLLILIKYLDGALYNIIMKY